MSTSHREVNPLRFLCSIRCRRCHHWNQIKNRKTFPVVRIFFFLFRFQFAFSLRVSWARTQQFIQDSKDSIQWIVIGVDFQVFHGASNEWQSFELLSYATKRRWFGNEKRPKFNWLTRSHSMETKRTRSVSEISRLISISWDFALRNRTKNFYSMKIFSIFSFDDQNSDISLPQCDCIVLPSHILLAS